jgi:L-alanine-DL-glutamate epimerase-like enolase superfamily enzyme
MTPMKTSRRQFLQNSAMGAAGASLLLGSCARDSAGSGDTENPAYALLDEALSKPVLKSELFPDPVIIDRLELRRYEDNFICRITSTDGAEGLSVANNDQMASLYPVFLNRLQPFFPGRDARDWETMLEEVYAYRSNYKLQNLALWVPLATIEFALLDMLGKIAGLPMGKLIGEIHNPRVAVYQANDYRGKSAAESIGMIRRQVARTGARAVKIKVGGRMSHNRDYPPGRTEALIPMVRKAFGEQMILYADSNGSYDVVEAIRVGQLMEEYRFDFFEEPVPFDWYEETRQVNEALTIPIAGGEQEPSLHNFRWLLGNHALDIVQPDIFYFGGMIRSMKVARMAEVMGKGCTPHTSGSGLGYLYMMHFVSALPNAGPFHEFKGFNRDIPLDGPGSSMSSFNGMVVVPTGPGLGMTIDPDFVEKHQLVEG